MLSNPKWLSRIDLLLPKGITFSVALYVSLAIHAVVLAIHFELPKALMHARDQALDVILVNSKSAHKPHDAQVRAQANLDGGGNTDEDRILSTPLPASHTTHAGDELAESRKRVAEMEAQQQQLMIQAKSARSVQTADRKTAPNPEQRSLTGLDLASNALVMAQLQGQIDRQTEEYNKRPRKEFFGVRATHDRFAQYEEDWRQKIERIGNLNYPAAAKGRLYGSLLITVEIKSDGSLASVQIDRPSGKKILDDAARRIVQMAGPYAPFPPNLHDTDIISITRTWSFTNEDRLQSN